MYNIEEDIKTLTDHGVIFDQWMDIEDEFYHSSPGISASGLKTIDSTSPAVYAYRVKNKKEKTPAMILGSAIHTFVLEHDRFDGKYLVAPSNRKSSREYKIFLNQHAEEISEEGKIILSKKDGETLNGILLSLKDGSTKGGVNTYDGIVANKDTLIEKALYTIDKERNIILKVKVDINMEGMLLDLKSTKSADPEKFMKDAANMGYGIQAAFYRMVMRYANLDSRLFGYIAVEKEPPYVHSVIILREEDIILENSLVERLLDTYASCMHNQLWYGPNGISEKQVEPLFITRGMPAWHRYRLEELNNFEGA